MRPRPSFARLLPMTAGAILVLTFTGPLAASAVQSPSTTSGGSSCDQSGHHITGTPGNDVLNGTSDADVIDGRGGNDTIDGRGGNDVVLGGGGNDQLRGGKGRDCVKGGHGRDQVGGGSGHDHVDGGSGFDSRLNPDNGDDVLRVEH
jgi:Ca2+-binding RTX toxin-like protein